MNDGTPFITEGVLVKVLTVNEASGTIQGIVQNGKAANVPGLQGELPAVGDIIMVGNNNWTPASEELWIRNSSVGIVRFILNEKEVLLEDGYALVLEKHSAEIGIAVGNTVEFNSVDGIVRILSPAPIRIRDAHAEQEDDIDSYRIDTSAGDLIFSDFGGYPEVIARARQLIETQFENRKYLDAIGAQPVKGILFTGPPGTGKTFLAKIIAQESKADFSSLAAPPL